MYNRSLDLNHSDAYALWDLQRAVMEAVNEASRQMLVARARGDASGAQTWDERRHALNEALRRLSKEGS